MKYLKFFEDIRTDTWNKYIDETVSKLTVNDLIYNTINLPSYYKQISDEDMLQEYGTSDKQIHHFISCLKHEKILWENYIHKYSYEFWRIMKSAISEKLQILRNDSFMTQVLESYLGKMGNLDDITERILNNSPIYNEKEKELYAKVEKNIKEYLSKEILDNPELYYKNDYCLDPYMEEYIPAWIKQSKNFNL